MQNKIERYLIALNLSLVLVSCGPVNQTMQNQSIDPSLVGYLSAFQSEGESRGVATDASHLTMSFSESMIVSAVPNCPSCQVIAYCQQTSIGNNVFVKGSFWNSQSVTRREMILFHELGHCLLNLKHINTTEPAYWYAFSPLVIATTVPSSIMNELQFDESVYAGNRATYLSREFGVATFTPLYWNAPSQVSNIY